MSALDEPSPKAIRPLASSVASRHRRVGSMSDRQLLPHAPLWSAQGQGLPREPESSHRPLVSEEPSPRYEKMEERLRAPSIVPVTLPASADTPGVSALRTRRLATPDRTTHHASSVTIWRDACAPFCSDAGFTQNLCRACERLRVPPLRLSPFTRYRGERLSPASAVSTVCSRLDRPSTDCLAARREARSRCVPTDFCFPLLRLRAPAPRWFPAFLRSFHFALGKLARTHNQETGGPGVFTTPDPLRRAARVGTRVLFRLLPNEPYL
jgi:hypothetical protein